MVLFGERGVEAIAATNDRGQFVSVTPPADNARTEAATGRGDPDEEEDEDGRGGVRLYESLYETALKNELPRQTVDELVRIFGFDVDFQRRVTSGRHVRDLLRPGGGQHRSRSSSTRRSRSAAKPAASTATRREDGAIDFFDELGRSLKKFLLRKPIADGDPAVGLRLSGAIRSSATRRCTPGSTGRTGSARRSSRPATARSSRPNGIRATAAASRSSTPTAT